MANSSVAFTRGRAVLDQMRVNEWIWPAMFIVGCIIIWEVVCRVFSIPEFVLPAPSKIVDVIGTEFEILIGHTGLTLAEAAGGFLLANILSLLSAVVFCYSPIFEKSVYPYLIALKTVPIVALAPLINLWFGEGMASKIVMAALISFFPMVVNAAHGLKHVDRRALDVMRVLSANETQILLKLRFPSALPNIVAALKISAPLAMVGAIVAELTAGSGGIGYLILVAAYRVETPYLFACIVFSGLGGLLFFGGVLLLEGLVTKRSKLSANPDRVWEYIRANRDIPESLAIELNKYGIERLRSRTTLEDLPHLERLTNSSKPAIRYLGYSLTHNLTKRGEPRAIQLLKRRWEAADELDTESAIFRERMQLMWQLLDWSELEEEWHREIYNFVQSNWDLWRRRTLNWTADGVPQKIFERVNARLADSEYPSSKTWAYLLQLTMVPDEEREYARNLARRYISHPNEIVQLVARQLAGRESNCN